MTTREELAHQHCQPRKGAGDGLDASTIKQLLQQLPAWQLAADGKSIRRDCTFQNFHHTLGFINALGFFANREDHHPDLQAGYGHCEVTWSTHDVGGLSMNDFICAARTDSLLD